MGDGESLTIESVNALLSFWSSDAAVDSLKSMAKILQEVLQYVQHTGHLEDYIITSNYIIGKQCLIKEVYLWLHHNDIIANCCDWFTCEKMRTLCPCSFSVLSIFSITMNLPLAATRALPS